MQSESTDFNFTYCKKANGKRTPWENALAWLFHSRSSVRSTSGHPSLSQSFDQFVLGQVWTQSHKNICSRTVLAGRVLVQFELTSGAVHLVRVWSDLHLTSEPITRPGPQTGAQCFNPRLEKLAIHRNKITFYWLLEGCLVSLIIKSNKENSFMTVSRKGFFFVQTWPQIIYNL